MKKIVSLGDKASRNKKKSKSFQKEFSEDEARGLTAEKICDLTESVINRLKEGDTTWDKELSKKEVDKLTKDELWKRSVRGSIPEEFSEIRKDCIMECIAHMDVRDEYYLWLIGCYLIQAYWAGQGKFDKK